MRSRSTEPGDSTSATSMGTAVSHTRAPSASGRRATATSGSIAESAQKRTLSSVPNTTASSGQAASGAHQEHPVNQLVTAAVVGHPLEVVDGERLARLGPGLGYRHNTHGLSRGSSSSPFSVIVSLPTDSSLGVSGPPARRASPGQRGRAPRVGGMRIALINSGLGLLAAAAELHKLRPDADLVLAMDPEGMPWGPRSPQDIADRSLAAARAAAVYQPDVLVFACNTGTVHALGPLRAEFEPGVPVVGTVPAIKPAAAHSGSVAVWATVATTGSAYQRQLIADFAGPARVTAV